MAKIKVHEIAKELEKQSKEIIAFLQDKGIEVKAAQSSIEDDVAAMVRKAFGGSKADTETAKEKEAAPVTAENRKRPRRRSRKRRLKSRKRQPRAYRNRLRRKRRLFLSAIPITVIFHPSKGLREITGRCRIRDRDRAEIVRDREGHRKRRIRSSVL